MNNGLQVCFKMMDVDHSSHLTLSIGLNVTRAVLKLNAKPCLCSTQTFKAEFIEMMNSFLSENGYPQLEFVQTHQSISCFYLSTQNENINSCFCIPPLPTQLKNPLISKRQLPLPTYMVISYPFPLILQFFSLIAVPIFVEIAEKSLSNYSISLLSSADSTLLSPFLFSIWSRVIYYVNVGRKSKLMMNETINFLGSTSSTLNSPLLHDDYI